MISNTSDLLDDILERQKKKFGKTTKEELWSKLRGEIIEYQQALRSNIMNDCLQTKVDIMLEQADIIILANRLHREFKDELAWLLIQKMYNYETAKFVKFKWSIVEKRPYYRDKNGNWQHKEVKNEVKRISLKK